MNKAEDIEQLIYRELPPDRYCYIHNFIVEKDKEIERLNNIINELEKSKKKQINEYEILILKIERYLNCYQYFLETQEENNKKIANMIHEFSLGSDE